MRILASEAEVGKVYKSLVFNWDLKVIRKEIKNDKVISVVIRSLKSGVDRDIFIKPTMELLYESDSETNGALSTEITENTKPVVESPLQETKKITKSITVPIIKQKEKGKNTMARTKNPKSQIIDAELIKVTKNTTPDWEGIAKHVIKVTKSSEEDKKKITAEIKVRWYGHIKNGKKPKTKAPKADASKKEAEAGSEDLPQADAPQADALPADAPQADAPQMKLEQKG